MVAADPVGMVSSGGMADPYPADARPLLILFVRGVRESIAVRK